MTGRRGSVVGQQAPIWIFVALVKIGLFLVAGERYGYLSDELYFLDAAARPALGYVDFPPLLPWLLAAFGRLGWDSLLALRGMAALTGLLVTVVGVDLCRILGGRAWACWMTALILLFAPGFLSVQSIMTMNVLDQLWWLAAYWLAARHLQTRSKASMLALGVILGLGVLTKLSILALCAALPLAWLIWDRSLFRSPVTWISALLAVALLSPYIAWQVANQWPFLDFVSAYNSAAPAALVLQNPLLGMVLTMNPAYAIFWGLGAAYVLLARDPVLRVLGTAAWLCIALFVWAEVKFYFAVPAFGLFSIAGVLFWQRALAARGRGWRALLTGVAASGVLAVPGAAPVLPEPQLQALARFLRDSEQGYPGREAADLERYFPHFAEMHGWPELVALVSKQWDGLSPAQREDAILMASHYGQAAALNQLDRDDRLPQAYGRHMSYHLWSRGLDYQHGLFVGFDTQELERLFATVRPLARLACNGCMARERGLWIHYVEGPRLAPDALHEALRRYDFY